MKQRFLRVGDELTDDTTVVVRGGDLDPGILRDDAVRNYDIYGTYGISVFAVRDLTLDELAQQAPLVRFERLALVSVGALRALGLSLEPTGRNPRHYDVTFADLAEGVDKLSNCEHQTFVNPYHEDEMSGKEATVTDDIDLIADLNAEDDDGLGWSTLRDARAADRIVPGAMVLAGNRMGQAVVRIVAVDDDGQVHFSILPGSVAKNRHLLGRTVA